MSLILSLGSVHSLTFGGVLLFILTSVFDSHYSSSGFPRFSFDFLTAISKLLLPTDLILSSSLILFQPNPELPFNRQRVYLSFSKFHAWLTTVTIYLRQNRKEGNSTNSVKASARINSLKEGYSLEASAKCIKEERRVARCTEVKSRIFLELTKTRQKRQ